MTARGMDLAVPAAVDVPAGWSAGTCPACGRLAIWPRRDPALWCTCGRSLTTGVADETPAEREAYRRRCAAWSRLRQRERPLVATPARVALIDVDDLADAFADAAAVGEDVSTIVRGTMVADLLRTRRRFPRRLALLGGV